jgi:hypothetical protein
MGVRSIEKKWFLASGNRCGVALAAIGAAFDAGSIAMRAGRCAVFPREFCAAGRTGEPIARRWRSAVLLSTEREAKMSLHKYKVGQTLKLFDRRGGSGLGAQFCKILRLLPAEDGQPQYRVKCTNEAVERVVKEFALSRQS